VTRHVESGQGQAGVENPWGH